MDRDVEESILEIHATKPCIFLDPITDLLKALHPEFMLLHKLIDPFRFNMGLNFPGERALATAKYEDTNFT